MDLEAPVDLVFIDFNNFTWNKEAQVTPFVNWLNRNRRFLKYFLYTDSFYFSLKFTKDETEAQEKYSAYLNRVEEALSMKLLTYYVFKNKNCSLLLLENEGKGTP